MLGAAVHQAGDVAGGVVVLAFDEGVIAVEGAGDAVIGVVGVLGAAALLVADEGDVAGLVVEGGDNAEARGRWCGLRAPTGVTSDRPRPPIRLASS